VAEFVYIVERGHENFDGPEIDVFEDQEVAQEHLRRARDVLGDDQARLTEQAVLRESYLPEENA
jgi:hypothetical protein